VPHSSQALLRGDGYRELLALYGEYHAARRPVFGALERAVDLRDAALLYELWTFFALAREVSLAVGEPAVIDVGEGAAASPLAWGARARFGAAGDLAYNAPAEAYSGRLRPDFAWTSARASGGARPEVVLDAKFRLERRGAGDGGETATALREDLAKMHAYRDALGVRAAVSVYPGDESVFFAQGGERREGFSLRALLRGGLSGVGALAMKPGGGD
jgi:predicted component of viral defense system (DUF524 family)